mmetsp:Transcript_70059/g.222050  ORF Transcript_70059/g.222050 Transcript_70059/m.222050 type:complete len:158 (+) Transcript_70059:1408-1881(+)
MPSSADCLSLLSLAEDGEDTSCFAVLPPEALQAIMSKLTSVRDHARASQVCRRWRTAADVAVRGRLELSLSKTRAGDAELARYVLPASQLQSLDMWGCGQVSDAGLRMLAGAECMPGLDALSLWGATRLVAKLAFPRLFYTAAYFASSGYSNARPPT